jgi:hypothetical protein
MDNFIPVNYTNWNIHQGQPEVNDQYCGNMYSGEAWHDISCSSTCKSACKFSLLNTGSLISDINTLNWRLGNLEDTRLEALLDQRLAEVYGNMSQLTSRVNDVNSRVNDVIKQVTSVEEGAKASEKRIDRLQSVVDKAHILEECPANWKRFGNACYRRRK